MRALSVWVFNYENFWMVLWLIQILLRDFTDKEKLNNRKVELYVKLKP